MSAPRSAAALLCLLLLLSPVPPSHGEPSARAQRLLALLNDGKPVRLLAFGDSLTAGWGTDGRQVYCRLVADTLQYAFPRARLDLVLQGHPGETTDGALRRFEEEVAVAQPDLLLVQFGGNDKGYGRRLQEFRRDLGELLRRAQAETPALVIGCLPPIVDPDAANPWNETARAVAQAEGVPAADLDRAIRAADPDYRGPFPYGSHPDSFTHVVMAREVLRALREALGLQLALTCRLEGASRLSAETAWKTEVTAANVSAEPISAALQCEWQGQTSEQTTQLAPRQTDLLTQALPLPPFAGRSVSLPVRLLSRGGGFGDLDVRWLTVAPAVRVDQPAATPDPEKLTWHTLSSETFTIGRHRWLGPQDLAARFAAVRLPEVLRFLIDVTDDDLTAADARDPSQGDSVELYLDLRNDRDQGKPVYGPQVVALQITPPVGERASRWQAMQPLPHALAALPVQCVRTASGYRAHIDLPLAVVRSWRGEEWEGFGFDVGVNDADAGGIRKTQVMWTGYPDDYLNPGYLGGLYLREVPPGATRQTLR